MTKELPQRGDVLHLDRTGEPIEVGERVGEGGQGVVHRARLQTGTQLALKWYRRSNDSPAQRASIQELAARRSPHPAFLFPLDTVIVNSISGFGYVMPWMDARFTTFAEVINNPRQLGLQTKARIGRKLAEAFGALHSAGLCYRDINFGNLWVDPLRGDVAVIDNDNVGTDDGHTAVWGVPRFMAPEVIRREAKPSTLTDLHSLAVLLFYLLMHGHPLEGARLEESYTWEKNRKSERDLALSHYGRKPLFIFHPTDESNRPAPGTGPSGWWPMYPSFVHSLFVQAFTEGLVDASFTGRVPSTRWREAMVQLSDLCAVCPMCTAAIVFDPAAPQRQCWNCSRTPAPVPMLKFRRGGHTVLLVPGATLSSGHVTSERDYDTVVALTELHPRMPNGVVLRNKSTSTWKARPDGEPSRSVEPGQAFAVRAGTIEFGQTTGQVIVADPDKTVRLG
jgi:eukaryotic-like serine/threonine-protein kinase